MDDGTNYLPRIGRGAPVRVVFLARISTSFPTSLLHWCDSYSVLWPIANCAERCLPSAKASSFSPNAYQCCAHVLTSFSRDTDASYPCLEHACSCPDAYEVRIPCRDSTSTRSTLYRVVSSLSICHFASRYQSLIRNAALHKETSAAPRTVIL